jgi:hypothetical protein
MNAARWILLALLVAGCAEPELAPPPPPSGPLHTSWNRAIHAEFPGAISLRDDGSMTVAMRRPDQLLRLNGTGAVIDSLALTLPDSGGSFGSFAEPDGAIGITYAAVGSLRLDLYNSALELTDRIQTAAPGDGETYLSRAQPGDGYYARSYSRKHTQATETQLARLDEQGVLVWSRSYDLGETIPDGEHALDLCGIYPTADGSGYLIGDRNYGPEEWGIVDSAVTRVTRIAADGTPQWTYLAHGTPWRWVHCALVLDDGSALVVVDSAHAGTAWLRFSTSGAFRVSQSLADATSGFTPYDLVRLPSGMILGLGMQSYWMSGSAVLFYLSAQGEFLSLREDGPNVSPWSSAVAADGAVVIAGIPVSDVIIIPNYWTYIAKIL